MIKKGSRGLAAQKPPLVSQLGVEKALQYPTSVIVFTITPSDLSNTAKRLTASLAAST